MASYLERLCIFICLGDLLANFLPSEKFTRLYRYVAGALVLLVVIQPLGKETAKLMESDERGIRKEFEERIAGQNVLWKTGSGEAPWEESEKVLEEWLGQISEETVKEELVGYGYMVDEESGKKQQSD